MQVALYCYLFTVLSCVFYLIGRGCSDDITLGQNLLYVFLHCYHGEWLYCTVLLFKNCPRLLLILSSLFNQVVMTIIVAFIIEAFLFRIQYRKEHPNDEKGTFCLLQFVIFFGKWPVGLIYADRVYLGVRTCELFFGSHLGSNVLTSLCFLSATCLTGPCTEDGLWKCREVFILVGCQVVQIQGHLVFLPVHPRHKL